MLRKGNTSRPLINIIFGLTQKTLTTFPKRTPRFDFRLGLELVINYFGGSIKSDATPPLVVCLHLPTQPLPKFDASINV